MNKIIHTGKKIAVISIILACMVYLALALYVAVLAATNTAVASDAIIVLGARSYLRGEYNPCLAERVKQGVKLYTSDYADTLIMAGGKDNEDGSIEAEVMKNIATEQGVIPEDIVLEPNSTSTYENLLYSKQLMDAHRLRSAIIVTAPYHVARATLVARKLKMQYSVSPAVDTPCWTQNKYLSRNFLSEPIAIVAYFLQGKL